MRGQFVLEIAEVVGLARRDQCEVPTDRRLKQVAFTLDLDDLLAILDGRAEARRGQDTAQADACRADALDQRSLGTSSTSISPEIILACVSGFSPMWEATTRETRPAEISLPIPLPGSAVSLATTVRFLCRVAQ